MLFSLSSSDSLESGGLDIGFAVETKEGIVRASFPLSKIDSFAWHDFAGSYDGKRLALFCDRKLLARVPCQGALVPNDGPLLIGAEMDGGKVVLHFHGELQEAGIWSRALTRGEIEILSH
jgi:hypothetical protein